MSETVTNKTKAGLRREIATPARDILVPVFGGLMRPTDDVLIQKGGGKGLKIYDEIERDPLAFAVLQKRKGGLVARDWKVDAGGPRRPDRKAAELAERVLNGEWGWSFDKVCQDLLDATLMGYSVAEVIWDYLDGFVVPVAIKPKDQRRFVFDDESNLRMLTFENPLFGEELPPRQFLVHRFGDKTGDPYGRGLGHQLFWWVYFKRMGTQFWLTFADKFGSPTVLGEVPDTMSREDEDTFLAKLASLAQQTALTVPQGAVVKFLEAIRSGSVTYPDLVAYCDQMITIAVLGETLTTSEGSSGSRALGEVHAEVKDEVVDADADLLSGSLNSQLMTWIAELNYPEARPPRVWRPRPTREEAEAKKQQEQLKAREQARAFVSAMRRDGWEPEDPQADLMDQWGCKWSFTGVRTAVLGDDRVEPPPQLAAPDRPRDAADDLAEQVRIAAAPAMDALIDQVRAIIAEAEDLEQAADLLLQRYADLDDGQLAEVMKSALELGGLTGAEEAANGRRLR